MSEEESKETLTLSLPRNVYRILEVYAATAQIDLGAAIEAALDEYFAIIERCDPDVRALVRVLVPPPNAHL